MAANTPRVGEDEQASGAVMTASELFHDVPAAECKAAIDLLAQRGLDRDERKRLAGLVQVALGSTVAVELQPAAEAARITKRRDSRRALEGWFEEWSSTARAAITRRDLLIRLGLAKRKVSAPKKPAPPVG